MGLNFSCKYNQQTTSPLKKKISLYLETGVERCQISLPWHLLIAQVFVIVLASLGGMKVRIASSLEVPAASLPEVGP